MIEQPKAVKKVTKSKKGNNKKVVKKLKKAYSQKKSRIKR